MMSKKIVIIGAGGHGKVVANIAKLNDYKEILFLDDSGTKDANIVGTTEDIVNYKDYDFIVAIGNNQIRKKFTDNLFEQSFKVVNLIHPTAVIDETVMIGLGSVVMANAVINAYAKLGKGCIVNTSATVDHDDVIEDYVHICPGVHIAGTTTIGYEAWIGIGASVINNVSIAPKCMIGAGTVVVRDIVESGTYVGITARRIK